MAEKDIVVDEEGNEVIESQVETKDVENEEDEREESSTDSDSSDETSENDDSTTSDESDDEREAIRERRRQERQHRKQAQKEREDTLRRELAARDTVINEMRQKLDVIERRNSGSEMAQLENAKKQTAQAYNYFKDQIRIATESQNGAAVADATEKMLQAQRKFDELSNYERAMKQRQASPQPLDPRLINHAQAWMNNNKWYDPSNRDTDSRITMTLDQQLTEEGWDPTTKEYWDELSLRVKKHLPHRLNGGKITSTKPKSVVAGSGRESTTVAKGQTYKLSADRVQALKDAGIWDDVKQRQEAIKRFRDYDKQHSQA